MDSCATCGTDPFHTLSLNKTILDHWTIFGLFDNHGNVNDTELIRLSLPSTILGTKPFSISPVTHNLFDIPLKTKVQKSSSIFLVTIIFIRPMAASVGPDGVLEFCYLRTDRWAAHSPEVCLLSANNRGQSCSRAHFSSSIACNRIVHWSHFIVLY